MANNQNKNNAISEYLSLLQLKYDCETICSLIPLLQRDGITSIGIIPYISLTVTSVLEFFDLFKNDVLQQSDIIQVQDARLKLKVFENGYSKSKRMILNIDYLQDQAFKNKLRFNFMRNRNIHLNLGVYTDVNKRVVGNTHYGYYVLQDNGFLKKRIEEVAKIYSAFPDKFDLNKQSEKDAFEYSYKCGQIIGAVQSALSSFDSHISISINKNHVDYYYADYNTNIRSSLFPKGTDGKATVLYLLHILSAVNFPLHVLNGYEKDDYGWGLKINYIAYYYAIYKLRDLQQHLTQNKLLTPNISDYFTAIGIGNAKYLNGSFRSCMMHSRLIDENGDMLIGEQNLDKAKPLFGLVESCFCGMSYDELKQSVIYETTKISDVLADWLGTQNLTIKPFKKEC